MTTKQLWEAVATYELLFQKFSNFPLMVNVRRQACETLNNPKRLKFFLLSNALVLITIACCYITVIGHLFKYAAFQDIELWKVLVYVSLSLINTALFFAQLSVLLYCQWMP